MGYLRYKRKLSDDKVVFTSVMEDKERDYTKCYNVANNRIKYGHYDSLQGFKDEDGDYAIIYSPS